MFSLMVPVGRKKKKKKTSVSHSIGKKPAGARIEEEEEKKRWPTLEESRLLRHQREELSILVDIHVLYVLAVDQDAPRLDVVEALQQPDNRRLARAARADQGGELTLLDRDAQVLEHGHVSRGILEAYVPQLDLDAALAVRDDHARRRRHLHVVVVADAGGAALPAALADAQYAVRGAAGLGGVGPEREAHAGGLAALQGRLVADEEVDDADLAPREQVAAVPEDEGVARQRQRVGQGEDDGRPPGLAVRRDDVLVEEVPVALVDLVLEREARHAAEGPDGLGGPLAGVGKDLGRWFRGFYELQIRGWG